jgi:LuxR family maltose regulon positive regulatory protein
MADRVLSELVGQRGRLILVIDDRHESTSHELTLPDALAQLTRVLTNLHSRRACGAGRRRDLPLRLHQLRLAGELAEVRATAGALATSRPQPATPAGRLRTA